MTTSDVSHTYVYVFHLIILPALIVVGILGTSSPKWLYSFLLGLGIVGMLYHSFKLYGALTTKHKKN